MGDNEVKVHQHIHMNFTKIYESNIQKSDFGKYKKKFANLPKYSKGTKDKHSDGFHDEDLIGLQKFDLYSPTLYDQNSFSMNKQGSIKPEDILFKSYYTEDYPKDSSEPIFNRVDVFWILPCNLLLINGAKENAKNAFKYLKDIDDELNFEEIKLEHDFLVWITCILTRRKGLLREEDRDIIIKRIDKGNTQNFGKETSRAPRHITVKHSIQADLSLPTIYGLLNNHEYSSIGGEFLFRDKTILAQLSTKRGIRISQETLQKKNYGERCTMVFPFIVEIINIFKDWKELGKKKKYPDKKYMLKMIKSFKEQTKECERNFELLEKKYLELRGEI